MKTYGTFTDDGLEYIVSDPHPPRDWMNYLWNGTYLASVSQNLNGCSLYQNEAGVLTNLFGKQDDNRPQRAIYIRDNDSGEFWSAAYRPCGSEQEAYECRQGLGYTVHHSEKNGVSVEIRIFVPRREAGEIWTVRVRNVSKKARNLSVFTVSEVVLDGVNMPYGYLGALRAEYLKEDGFLFFQNTSHNVVEEKYSALMYSDRKPQRFDTSKEEFLGKTRNPACPDRVVQGKLSNSISSVEYLIGALQHNLTLKPGRSSKFNVVLCLGKNLKDARRVKRLFADSAKIEKEFEAMKKANIARTRGLSLQTPDGDFNRLFGVWLKHQLYLMADWARFYFKGYRDTCQDAAGMSVIDPGRAFDMLKKALRNQRSDGFCPRAFRVASMDIAAADKHYCDSPSWISHATDALLRETGDLSLLDEVVAYSDQGGATVWEHNLQAMEFLWNDRGPHGLSLMHFGDWCDLLDKVGVEGKGESVWMSFALARVLRLTGQIARWKGDTKTATLCSRRFRQLRRNLQKHGWDGRHFLAAISDDGTPIGSGKNKEGQIFINPQSWAMLSGVLEAEAYTEIAERIEKRVDTPVGPVHCWPPYTRYRNHIGHLSGTPPGFFTNGNVYCHAASFKIAADFDAGRQDKAFDTLMRILPSAERSEPYAQANGYVGPTAMRRVHHVSDDPWRTGTVAWNFLNVVDRMLGFQREPEGIRLEPKLPSKWKTVSYVRPFRGIDFEIEIRKNGTPGITVNGETLEGNFIAVPVGKNRKRKVNIVCVTG